jgi:Flp pilus assembly protein TadD
MLLFHLLSNFTNVVFILFLITLCACVPQNQLTTTPKNTLTATNLLGEADTYFKNADYEKAIPLYQSLITEQPEDNQLRFTLAESFRLSGESLKSLEHYNHILGKEPQNMLAREGLGLALLQEYNFVAATDVFLELLEQDASRWRTINALGVLYALQDKTEEAQAYYEMALALAPDNPSVLNNMGLAYVFTDKVAYGIELFTQALSLSDANQDHIRQITLNMALAHGMAGNEEKATQLLTPYLSTSAIYNNLGVYASLRNDKKLARTYLSKALTERPVFYEKAWKNLDSLGN